MCVDVGVYCTFALAVTAEFLFLTVFGNGVWKS